MPHPDESFAEARKGNPFAFVEWMGSAELPIRLSLRRFAQAVDVESIVQETLLRMWLLAQDPEKALVGENAALKFAIVLARNLARNEARRIGRERLLPPEDLPPVPVDPSPTSDPRLAAHIKHCLDRLKGRSKEALMARLRSGATQPDTTLAAAVSMTLNTFLQNIVRARKSMEECLEKRGVRLSEVMS
jgi:DNA-directed RNA polymerase specialized sigma24 family protein